MKTNYLRGCLTALALALLGSGCTTRSVAKPASIDLTKYYDATLTTSLNSPSFVKENNLANLPSGRQFFSGVPFEVGGVLQLSGKKIKEWGRNEFPEGVDGIPVGRNFSELHLLHGAGGVYDSEGVTIATIVLHYADGSTKQLEIKNGVDVRDWWGKLAQPVTGTNSALAWTGSNPAFQKYGGDAAGGIRIYTSTFTNPQPSIRVTSLDYRSTMENSSPFLIAATVE